MRLSSIHLLCRLRNLAKAFAVLVALAGGSIVSAADADTGVAPVPGAVVASDGSRHPAAPLSVLESLPFPGTGVLPEGARAAYAPPGDELPPMVGYATESVIGEDERRQVTDTTAYPYRAIALLELTYPSGNRYSCTGFFVDADTVATAGHCVYSHSEGSWVSSIIVYPGRNGDDTPYGSANATAVFALEEWFVDADHRYDYGAIKVDSPLGNTVGWLGYGVKIDQNVLKANVRIFGYPGDKPWATMWGTRRRIKGVDPDKVFYKIDTAGGQSGSPIYGKLSNVCQPCAFGIHAYGTGIAPFGESNSGTRVNASVLANLLYWASQ